MGKPLVVIKHWTGATILVNSVAPELGLATLEIRHGDGLFSVSAGLAENELKALRDGIDKALELIAPYQQRI